MGFDKKELEKLENHMLEEDNSREEFLADEKQQVIQYNQASLGNLTDQQKNHIIEKYLYIVKIYIKKLRIDERDYDDALQIGRIGILKAMNSYREHCGSNFATFVSICVKTSLISYQRNLNRKKHSIMNNRISLDTEFNDDLHKMIPSHTNVEEEVINQIYYSEVYRQASQGLKPLEKDVYKYYVDGYSINEIQEHYDLSKKQVYSMIAKAKRVLTKGLYND
jgi:RNA polymerase sporulation-specific sigma factor